MAIRGLAAAILALPVAWGLCDWSDPVKCVRGYNVVWKDFWKEVDGFWVNSMPIGNGDVGANVFVESDTGAIGALLAQQGAFDESGEMIKVGLVNLSLSPSPWLAGRFFQQELDLGTGTINIFLGGAGRSRNSSEVMVSIYIDANSNVMVADVTSRGSTQYAIQASLTPMRTGVKKGSNPAFNCFSYDVSADVVGTQAGRPYLYHRNEQTSYFADAVRAENLGSVPSSWDRLSLRTTGVALLQGSATRVVAQVLTQQTASAEEWVQKALEPAPESRQQHEAWWSSFWSRGHLEVSDKVVSSQFLLQRFITAAQARSPFPVKFNGMLFMAQKPPKADDRVWGGLNWWQNLRLPYYSALPTGDFDLLESLLESFLANLPMAQARSKHYRNFSGGAVFPEYTHALFGTSHSQSYGCNRTEGTDPPYWFSEDIWNHYNWQGGLDLSLFILDHFEYTGDAGKLQRFLPIVTSVLGYYRQAFPVVDGKLHIYPTQALETWQCPGWPPAPDKCATNDMPTIAGLEAVLEKALRLPPAMGGPRDLWRSLQASLPPLPAAAGGGKLLPCEVCPPSESNSENPELYAVHPYRRFTVGRLAAGGPALGPALAAWDSRRHLEDVGWNQNAMDAALLGLAGHAQELVFARALAAPGPGYRFPVQSAAYQDFTPSSEHLAVFSAALTYMAIQPTDAGGAVLLPAWPCGWDADFDLRAPGLRIKGTFKNGTANFTVVPAEATALVKVASCQHAELTEVLV